MAIWTQWPPSGSRQLRRFRTLTALLASGAGACGAPQQSKGPAESAHPPSMPTAVATPAVSDGAQEHSTPRAPLASASPAPALSLKGRGTSANADKSAHNLAAGGASSSVGSKAGAANATEPSATLTPGGLSRGGGEPGDRALLAGDEAYFEDDLARAKAEYRRAEGLLPNDPAPRLGLLRVELAATGVPTDYGIAPKNPRVLRLLQQLEELARRHPNYGPVQVERGRVLLILGRAEPAIEALVRGAELSPADPEAHSALAVALLATGKSKEAVPRFRKAVELDPESADRHRNLGTAELMVGDVRQAIVAYQRAVTLAPNDPRSHSDLGTAFLAMNAVDLALPELRRAIELDPKRATFRSNLAYASLLKGDLEAAEREAREAVRLDPKLGSAHINLGSAQVRRGLYDEAERSFRKALSLDPSDPRALANLEELAEIRKKSR